MAHLTITLTGDGPRYAIGNLTKEHIEVLTYLIAMGKLDELNEWSPEYKAKLHGAHEFLRGTVTLAEEQLHQVDYTKG